MVNNEMIKNWHTDLRRLRLVSFRENVINFIETTLFDALIGMLAAVVVVSVIQYLVIPFLYELFTNTAIMTGVVKEVYTLEEVKLGEGSGIAAMLIRILNKLKWKETWLVLFGIRFVINYLVHGFNSIRINSKRNQE